MNKDMKDVVLALLEKSKAKEVRWVHASTVDDINPEGMIPMDAQDFAVHTPSYTINIYRSDSDGTIRLLLYNEFANLVTNEPVSTDDPFYSTMAELVDLARRYALDEDKLLRRIKASLKESGVLGSSKPESNIES